jgi:hypothetical protein
MTGDTLLKYDLEPHLRKGDFGAVLDLIDAPELAILPWRRRAQTGEAEVLTFSQLGRGPIGLEWGIDSTTPRYGARCGDLGASKFAAQKHLRSWAWTTHNQSKLQRFANGQST